MTKTEEQDENEPKLKDILQTRERKKTIGEGETKAKGVDVEQRIKVPFM
jgi:hypothetical protein